MADELTAGGSSVAFYCPWCSAVLPSTDLETCPSCKATLTSTGEAALPGVTAIDHEALLRSNRPVRQPRSRFLSWLSGEYVEESGLPADQQAIAPPDAAVRAEILRLEIEAELADRQAEADSLMADAVVEGRPVPAAEPAEADDVVAAAADEAPGTDVEEEAIAADAAAESKPES